MNVVFAGPTIRHEEVLQHLDCVCLPPISHGDILRILPDKPDAIGIIDGYFEGAPSVWHKEILYALDQGVRVYGSSSMGALRAMELHPFGMQGVGQIFEWYRDGVVLDDDEVAVLHGPAEVDFMVASEPMVNIRATLALAVEHRIIERDQESALLRIAKGTFYKKRRWVSLLDACGEVLKDKTLAPSVMQWLQQNHVDLKGQDALRMLDTMNQDNRQNSTRPETHIHFEWTQVWDLAYRESQRSRVTARTLGIDEKRVLDQLRLDPDRYERYHDKSLLSWMSTHQTEPFVQDSALKEALKQFRARNKLASRTQLTNYMRRADLDESTLIELIRSVSCVEKHRYEAGDLQPDIIDQLKLDGHYFTFLDIANQKKQELDSAGIEGEQAGLLPAQVIAWYFVDRLSGLVPARLEDHLTRIGMDSTDDFYRLISEEYLYCKKHGS